MFGSEKKPLMVWKTAPGEIRKNEICLHCIYFKHIDLARAKSEALFNIYRFLKENIKSSNTKDKLKLSRTLKITTIDLISKKQLCTCSLLLNTWIREA